MTRTTSSGAARTSRRADRPAPLSPRDGGLADCPPPCGSDYHAPTNRVDHRAGATGRLIADEAGRSAPRASPRARRYAGGYVLTDILRCACGARMAGTNSRSYRYYRCVARCGRPHVRADLLDSGVMDLIRRTLITPKTIREMIDIINGHIRLRGEPGSRARAGAAPDRQPREAGGCWALALESTALAFRTLQLRPTATPVPQDPMTSRRCRSRPARGRIAGPTRPRPGSAQPGPARPATPRTVESTSQAAHR